jgi:phosphatidylinositol alpha-1,6-mannosyltransferase
MAAAAQRTFGDKDSSLGECRMRRRLTVSAQHLEPGQGGIARAARLSVKALAATFDLRALAVMDARRHAIGNVDVIPLFGSRLRFVIANAAEAIAGRNLLYDFPGTARAHLPGFRIRSSYALWIHGIEVWRVSGPRNDYASAVRAADLILVNSNYTLTRAEEVLGALPQAQVCWLGTEQDDTPVFPPRRDGPPTLVFLGRSDDLFAKGQDILIDVWPHVISRIPDARLVFAGGGTQLEKLIRMAQASPAAKNIEVLGLLSDAEVEVILQNATALAMLSYVEGFGLVFVEAMRHGLPILASTDDASQEINADGVTGFNVSRKDRSGIIDRLVFLLRERDRSAALGRAGLERWRNNFRFSTFQQRIGRAVMPWLGKTGASN